LTYIELFKNIFRAQLAKPLIKKNSNIGQLILKKNIFKKKKFYIIKRIFAASGIFSNLTFVIDQIIFAKKKKLIPIIDMENFPTVYNENKKINNSKNSWDYFFKPLNNYKLNNIYKNSQFIFSPNEKNILKEIDENKKAQSIFFKTIKFRKIITNSYFKKKKIFFKNNKKILGVHIRGTLQRIVAAHSYPPKPIDILNEAMIIFKKYNCDKVFLVTEDEIYFNIFKKNFKKKLITNNTPRSKVNFLGSHNSHFENYNRRNHRFNLGKETIIDTFLLSDSHIFLYTNSNVSRYAKVLSKKKQIRFEFKTKLNSKNKFLARWKWYLKNYIPFIFGSIKYKIIKH
jgi:hypothetical protein